MLQSAPQQSSRSQLEPRYEGPDQGFDVWSYVVVLKRRKLLLILPFILVLVVGFVITMSLPPIFRSEARILVESQQIPTELVRPTVTAGAKERIQVIEQRVMTRENLLGIVEKFQLFPGKRQSLSGTELMDMMSARASLRPVELESRRRNDLTIALTVSFEYEVPQLARSVANELVTLILNEDARNRTNRASETTRFLSREVKKLETDLGTVEGQIADLKRKTVDPVSERVILQLATLRAELSEKSGIYSNTHPELVRLKRQIAALEDITAKATQSDNGLDALQNQRASIQKNLELASQRLSAARLGESLERDQFSERLEILEQAVTPIKPVKPNRPKMLAMVLALAMMAGMGSVVAAEVLNGSVRTTRDLYSLADPQLITSVPYIATRAELARQKAALRLGVVAAVPIIMFCLVAVHLFVKPLDELWLAFMARLLG
jgi:protein tyrosine kinase modulator